MFYRHWLSNELTLYSLRSPPRTTVISLLRWNGIWWNCWSGTWEINTYKLLWEWHDGLLLSTWWPNSLDRHLVLPVSPPYASCPLPSSCWCMFFCQCCSLYSVVLLLLCPLCAPAANPLPLCLWYLFTASLFWKKSFTCTSFVAKIIYDFTLSIGLFHSWL